MWRNVEEGLKRLTLLFIVMPNYTCNHCDSTFTSKYNLDRHQRRALYCLQGRKLEREDCVCLCGKRFSRNVSLDRHQDKCVIFKQTGQTSPEKATVGGSEELLLKVIDQYGEMVKDLQKQITELSSRPTKITNNTNNVLNNLQPITDEDLQEHLANITLDFIQEGAKGMLTLQGIILSKTKCFVLIVHVRN